MPASPNKSSVVKREVRSTFDFISSDYDSLRGRVWEDLAEFARETLFSPRPCEGEVILDLACGNARHATYFSENYRVRGIAIDFSMGLLKLAKRRIRASKMEHMVALINGDASRIPLRNRSIYAALYIAAIHHLPTTAERVASLREISRVLVHDGRSVVTFWRKWQRRFISHFLKERLGRLIGRSHEGEFGDIHIPWRSDHGATSALRFYHLFSKRETERLLSEAGFKLIRISKSSKKAVEGSFFICVQKK